MKFSLIPMLLFMILLFKKPPDTSLSKKAPSSHQPTLLHGRKYCIVSTLQSVHTNDAINYHFSDIFKAQCHYVATHTATSIPAPRIPHRLQHKLFHSIQLLLPSGPDQ